MLPRELHPVAIGQRVADLVIGDGLPIVGREQVAPHGVAVGIVHRREGGKSLPAALQLSLPIHTRELNPCVPFISAHLPSTLKHILKHLASTYENFES